MQSRSSSDLRGIDISSYQSGINFSAIKAAGIDVVYLKASEGEHTVDSCFSTFYSEAKAAGLKVGAYHFFHVGGSYNTTNEVNNFCSVISGKDLDCLAAIDVESGGYHGGDASYVTGEVLSFANQVKANTGYDSVVYSNTAFIKSYFTSSITSLPAWIADYNAGQTTPGSNGIWSTWDGFQYTDSGSVAGYSVDCDAFTTGILTYSAPLTHDGVYTVSCYPYSPNATAGTEFDVRYSDGTVASGHYVSNGDVMCILNVNYDLQLAEVVYPITGGYMHGYISNLQDYIHDYYHFDWHNGSTNEIVYGSSTGTDQIGTIYPYEYATPLYPLNGRYALLYNTSKGDETKFGFVNYHDGFSF